MENSHRKHNKHLVPQAKSLRKNMTKEERHLWYDFLRNYHIRVMRQKIIGRYIVDFYCASARLVIELDGSQHYDPETRTADEERSRFLNGYGIEVIRIPNNEIFRNFNGVCEYIDNTITERVNVVQQ